MVEVDEEKKDRACQIGSDLRSESRERRRNERTDEVGQRIQRKVVRTTISTVAGKARYGYDQHNSNSQKAVLFTGVHHLL
jgi:hypothetical protein